MYFDSRESLASPMENPFSLKVGQVFTGFGVGCGFGIGIGRPIYLGCNDPPQNSHLYRICFHCTMDFGGFFKGKDEEPSSNRNSNSPCAIPMLQQVMSATRGAADAFSGVGRHANSSLQKLGMKNIEAGGGCGVGLGHGFGVGIALKPGVIQRIQSSLLLAMTKLMLNMGFAPSLSSVQSFVPGSVQNSISALTSTSTGSVQSSLGNVVNLAAKGSNFYLQKTNESVLKNTALNPYDQKETSDRSPGSRTEKVLDSFLQNPVFKEEDVKVNELAENLRSENNVLQMLLKHQQVIQELVEENQNLQRVLIEDLKVPPSKLLASSKDSKKSNKLCSDCFECRRKKRKAGR